MKGKWLRQGKDDIAMADSTFPKQQYPAALARHKVVELNKAANSDLIGVEAKIDRGIRGEPYFAGGALPFRVSAGYFSYYCVPLDYRPDIRGQIKVSGETDTWIDVYFNSFGNLLGGGLGNIFGDAGKDLSSFPKLAGTLRGLDLYQLNDTGNRRHQIVIIAPESKSPYRSVSRKEYLEVRLKKDKISSAGPQFLRTVKRRVFERRSKICQS